MKSSALRTSAATARPPHSPPVAAPPPSSTTPSSARRTDAADASAHLRMLSSPLRRCLLTNKVLPTDLLVKFALVRPPPSSSSSPPTRLHLVPSGLLHPRYDPHHRAKGKGAWVTCWKNAVETLAKKGSYKRVNPSAYLDPSTAVERVHSQLARRVVQEVEMFVERAKSWPAMHEAKLAEAPVFSMTRDEWEVKLQELEKAPVLAGRRRRRVVAMIDLDPASNPSSSRFSTSISNYDGRHIPSYRLSTFFADVRLPPSTLPSPASMDGPPPPASEVLLNDMRTRLDELVSLWQRRAAKHAFPSPSSSIPPPSRQPSPVSASSPPSPASPSSAQPTPGDIYVLTTPILPSTSSGSNQPESPEDALRRRQAEDVVPLLVALKRCSLWCGEGWEVE